MKKLLAIMVLCLCFATTSQADDIRDFQIEGISVGDSLLDYFSKKKIKKAERYDNTNSNYKSDKFFSIRLKNIGKYTEMMFSIKKNDESFKTYSVQGLIKHENNISECYKKIDKISDEIETLFVKANKRKQDHAHRGDKTGKSRVTTISFTLKSGDRINLQCYDWTKKMKYWDNLRVGIYTKEFTDWLNREAYK